MKTKAAFIKLVWENEARTIATFYFRPANAYRYVAGQYAVISLPHPGADSRGYERTMTLSSSPDDVLLGFTMRIMSSGPSAPRGDTGSSFKRALLGLGAGETITVFDSMGDLVLPLSPAIPLVFIAGGVGIASFTGMTRWLTQHQDPRNIQLYHIVARPADLVMQQVFKKYAEIGHLTTSLHTPSVKRIFAKDIVAGELYDSLYYLSGTEKLVEELRQGLLDQGVYRSNIIFDYFDGYSEL